MPPTVKSTNRKHDQNYIDNHSHNNFFKFAPASKYFGGKPKNELLEFVDHLSIKREEKSWNEWVYPRAEKIADALQGCYKTEPVAVTDFISKEKYLYLVASNEILNIAYGNAVDLTYFAPRDKTVFLYFTAKWCKQCRIIKPVILEIAERKKILYREIDIIDWESEAHNVYIEYARKFEEDGSRLPGLILIENGKVIFAGAASSFRAPGM